MITLDDMLAEESPERQERIRKRADELFADEERRRTTGWTDADRALDRSLWPEDYGDA